MERAVIRAHETYMETLLLTEGSVEDVYAFLDALARTGLRACPGCTRVFFDTLLVGGIGCPACRAKETHHGARPPYHDPGHPGRGRRQTL